MPTNQLAPPDMPWLTGNAASPPNPLGPPLLNYAAPPPDASTSQGAAVAQTAANVAQALPSWPSVEEQRQMLQPLPGWQGTAVDAARQWAEGVMMGTTAPGEAASPAEQMWDAFDAAHAKSGLAGVSHVKLFQHAPDQLEISHIQVDPEQRGQGVGNTLMGTLTDLADQHGVTLHASPASDADGSSGLDYEGLRDWYQRWGFDEAGGGDRLTRRPGDVPPPGIVAYHGSPHSFDAFDSSKLHPDEAGHYVTQDEKLAQDYAGRSARDPTAGHMYEVNIKADPAQFLDYGSMKPEEQAALNDPGAVQKLRDAGVPGITFPGGTHVVFDANTLSILKKYGIAGLIAGGGAAAAGTQQQQPQPTPGS